MGEGKIKTSDLWDVPCIFIFSPKNSGENSRFLRYVLNAKRWFVLSFIVVPPLLQPFPLIADWKMNFSQLSLWSFSFLHLSSRFQHRANWAYLEGERKSFSFVISQCDYDKCHFLKLQRRALPPKMGGMPGHIFRAPPTPRDKTDRVWGRAPGASEILQWFGLENGSSRVKRPLLRHSHVFFFNKYFQK